MIFKGGENKMFKEKLEQFNTVNLNLALREKCPYMEFFLIRISRIQTQYGGLLGKSPYSIQIRENTD